MKQSLKTRMIIWIWCVTAFVFGIMSYISFQRSHQEEVNDLKETARVQALYYEKKFDKLFSIAMIVPRMIKMEMETTPGKPRDEINSYLKKVVEENSFIYGSCIALSPGEGRGKFAPYYYRSGDEVKYVNLAKDEYNYPQKEWFDKPYKKGSAMWTEPYFDEGGGEVLMTTYSVPFYHNGKFQGIATADISLDELSKDISRLRITDSGYGFIVNRTGYFLSFPDRKQILKGDIFNYDRELALEMTTGKSGFLKKKDPLKNRTSWIVYNPIKVADFSIAVVYPENEIMTAIYERQRYSMFIGIAGLIVMLLVIILLSNSITNPLSKLVESTRSVAGGNLDEQVKTNAKTQEVLSLEMAFNNMVDKLKVYILNLKSLYDSKTDLFLSSIKALANAIEARDFYTRGHSHRVTEFAVRIAREMNLSEDEIESIRNAALLHDIGKIKISAEVLHKPARLSDEEYELMKQHPDYAVKILRPVKEFKDILPYIFHHHERYDGKGYPYALSKDEIPLAARIIAVADSFDAMTSDRPYRDAMPVEKATDELKKNRGSQFDPESVDIFLMLIKEEKEWLDGVMKDRIYSSKTEK